MFLWLKKDKELEEEEKETKLSFKCLFEFSIRAVRSFEPFKVVKDDK